MKIACLLATLLWSALPLCAAEEKKSLPERVDDFCEKYKTEAEITARLAEWSKAEPDNPDPYVLAFNAYLRFEYRPYNIYIGEEAARPGHRAAAGPRLETTKLALSTLSAAAAKFPHRLDIHFGRMYAAECAYDDDALVLAAKDMLKAIQIDREKMRWIDDAPLPEPLGDSVPRAFVDRIAALLDRNTEKDSRAAHAMAVQGLKYAPGNEWLLEDAKLVERSIDELGAKKKK